MFLLIEEMKYSVNHLLKYYLTNCNSREITAQQRCANLQKTEFSQLKNIIQNFVCLIVRSL